MKQYIYRLLVLPAVILAFNLQTAIGFAQGTAFTYQGRLESGGAPASGIYDLRFTIYDALTNGSVLAGPVTNAAVNVTNGLFTTTVDFGNVFTGGSNWLAIAVSTNGANAYSPLSPRQQLTPVPYAIIAGNVSGTIPATQLPDGLGGSGNTATNAEATVSGGDGNTAGGVASTVGGGQLNSASSVFATVSGGNGNTAGGSASTVDGGQHNTATNQFATVSGGIGNIAGGSASTVGGGQANTATNLFATVGGGAGNTAGGYASMVGGGIGNKAANSYATVPGGAYNVAGGQYSFAAGQNAQALNDGSFVWADDSSGSPFASTANNQFLIRAAGGVGIGTTAPRNRLDVVGDVPGTVGVMTIQNKNTNGFSGAYFHDFDGTKKGWVGWINSTSTGLLGPGTMQIGAEGNARTAFVALNPSSGNVGIGTTTPAAGLDVESSPAGVNHGNWAYLNLSGFSNNNGSGYLGSPNLDIYTSGNIGAATYYEFSDERLKNIIGVSSGAQDLKRLMRIRVTDFTYKDTIKYGDRPVKKVIAQQVQSIYPQAVTQTTGAIPDIYQRADIKDGWIQLATNLKKGARVELISENRQGIYPVLAVKPGAFRTAFHPAGDKVFVYGREVNNLLTVDYDAISMLNVSATQEIARRLNKETAEVAAQKTENAKLQVQVTDLQSQLESLQKAVARLAGKSAGGFAFNAPRQEER